MMGDVLEKIINLTGVNTYEAKSLMTLYFKETTDSMYDNCINNGMKPHEIGIHNMRGEHRMWSYPFKKKFKLICKTFK